MRWLLRVFALCRKEWLSLLRDWHALALLFLMPAAFIAILSLGLEGLYHRQTGVSLTVGLVDEDQTPASKSVVAMLTEAGMRFRVVPISGDAQRHWPIPAGCEALIAIPKGFGKSTDVLQGDPSKPLKRRKSDTEFKIIVQTTPSLDLPYRWWIKAQMQEAILRTVTEDIASRVKKDLPGLASSLEKMGDSSRWIDDGGGTDAGHAATITSPLQLNVPGWSLFAMFMIALPLATGMVRERRDGLTSRLQTMPLGPGQLFLGKIIPYATVNTLQFALMLAFGLQVVPRLTSQPVAMVGSLTWMAALVAIVALSSTAFGLAVGVWSRTTEQATALADGVVVVASALGGIMVPVFAMPPALQTLAHASPLYWAHVTAVKVMTGVATASDMLLAGKVLTGMALALFLLAAWGMRRVRNQGQ